MRPALAQRAAACPQRYLGVEQVGAGSFGSVYRARDVQTGELVALKVFHNAGKEVRVTESQSLHGALCTPLPTDRRWRATPAPRR